MTRLHLSLSLALAALALSASPALGALHVVRGSAIPPNPRKVPPNTIVVGGAPPARQAAAAIPPAPRDAGPTSGGPRVAFAARGKVAGNDP